MSRSTRFAWFPVVLLTLSACTQAPPPAETKAAPKAEPAVVGQHFQHDGIDFYYEVYGSGEPLLLIHENGGNGANLKAEIEYFKLNYQVIVMDSRDQGRSGDSPDKINYGKMTEDQVALLDHLKVGPVNVVGWSDGGIEALLLGMRHPDKVKKIVSMAANMKPEGIHPEAMEWIKQSVADLKKAAAADPKKNRDLKVVEMMLTEPQVNLKELAKITAPTLILASDHDLIRDEHTIDIYHHIPNAQLNIFANALHTIPLDDPQRFCSVIERFLKDPFVPKKRLDDALKSFETAPQPTARQ